MRACAVEMSQEPFYARIYRKKSRNPDEAPDQAPALTLTVRTPQCGHTVWRTSAIVAFIMYFSSVAFTRLNHSGLLEHVVSEPQSEYPLNDWPF